MVLVFVVFGYFAMSGIYFAIFMDKLTFSRHFTVFILSFFTSSKREGMLYICKECISYEFNSNAKKVCSFAQDQHTVPVNLSIIHKICATFLFNEHIKHARMKFGYYQPVGVSLREQLVKSE